MIRSSTLRAPTSGTAMSDVPRVYTAISAVSRSLSSAGIPKARRNQQQGYAFRGIDDVLNALSSALVSAGLVILPRCTDRLVVERQTAKGGALFSVTCRVEFDLVATEDGSRHTVVTYGEAMDSADKATNKAMSAAYKYLALLVFCVPTEGTPDADAETHDVVAGPEPDAPSSVGMPASALNDWLAAIAIASHDELRDEVKAGMAAAKAVGDAEAFARIKDAGKTRHDEFAKRDTE